MNTHMILIIRILDSITYSYKIQGPYLENLYLIFWSFKFQNDLAILSSIWVEFNNKISYISIFILETFHFPCQVPYISLYYFLYLWHFLLYLQLSFEPSLNIFFNDQFSVILYNFFSKFLLVSYQTHPC